MFTTARDPGNAATPTGGIPVGDAQSNGANHAQDSVQAPVIANGLTDAHRAYLRKSGAITDAVMDSSGILSTPEGLAFPWQGPGLEEGCYQMRPDNPGEGPKYVGPGGVQLPFNRLRETGDDGPIVIVEGTKQALAVLSWAPAHYSVYGIAGCRAWSKLPLTWVDDRNVVVMFDGDMGTNRDVYDAAVALSGELEIAGAMETAFAKTPAQGKQGVDDVLASMPEGDRAKSLNRWLSRAKPSPGRAPARKNQSMFFDANGLKVQTLASDILKENPAALTAEDMIAMYTGGVYKTDGKGLMGAVVKRLGEQYRHTYQPTARDVVASQLADSGAILPERMTEPLANFTNGMVDLRTGVLTPHDPAHMSRVQHPVMWDPDATCPLYEKWLLGVLPDQADGIEEIAGSMLDPSRTPAKAMFAYGPSHSGKSTFIRLMEEVAGADNLSGVTLHALADDPFASANVYGKCLNASADLSPKDVSDLSVFKMMTGDDVIQANRKYGGQFAFRAKALFAFSANGVPAVPESSKAYVNRMQPFHFALSFAGREDVTLEPKLCGELPGIVQRWARAYRAYLERGAYLPIPADVAKEFAQSSDRTLQWLSERAYITAAPGQGAVKTALFADYMAWCKEGNYRSLGLQNFNKRLDGMDGVMEVRVGPKRSRGYNIVLAPGGNPFQSA